MRAIGIDPGQSGGIAQIDYEGVVAAVMAWPMPETEHDTAELFRSIKSGVICVAYIESVHSFPGQGVASSFTFGKNYGFLRGLLVGFQIPFIDVSPMKWKKALGLNFTAQDSKKDKKNGSKQLAQQWWPHLKITHKTSEALLIAEYGHRQNR